MKKVLLTFCLTLITMTLGAPCFAPLPKLDSTRWAKQYPDMTAQVRVLFITRMIDRAVTLTQYQAHDSMTFCNILARDVLDGRAHYWHGYGFLLDDSVYDVSSVFEKPIDILRYSIKEAWNRADWAWRHGKIQRLTREEAQEAANQGYLVWCISEKWNHECIIYPGKYCPDMGNMIAQAGGKGFTGIMRLYDDGAFGWRREGMRFYLFPEIHIKRRG